MAKTALIQIGEQENLIIMMEMKILQDYYKSQENGQIEMTDLKQNL